MKKRAANLGFGTLGALDKSRGFMAQFVSRTSPVQQEAPNPEPTAEEKVAEVRTCHLAALLPAESHCGIRRLIRRLLRGSVQLQARIEAVDHIRHALVSSEDIDVEADWHALLRDTWKARGFATRTPGVPPSFSRRPNCPSDPAELAKPFGHHDWRGVRTWRRKLLHFPADSKRPPFYGSFSRPRCATTLRLCLCPHQSMAACSVQAPGTTLRLCCSTSVKPRRPLARDADMDYEVMSDEDWEEEPEGEELDGVDGDEDEEECKDGDEDDGFMVEGAMLSLLVNKAANFARARAEGSPVRSDVVNLQHTPSP